MASYTTNLNLKKPAGSENVSIGDINNNMDTIDSAYGNIIAQKTVFVQLFNQNIAGTTTSAATTALDVSSYIPEGYSLWSAEAQIQDGSYFYNLPWFNDSLAQATWIERITNASVIIKNKASWSANTSVTLTLHCKKN